MASDEVVYVESKKVNCEGEGELIGHPRVYLDLSKTGDVVCPYCSKHFKYKK
jgi:uncharacterized Zn-finger protein